CHKDAHRRTDDFASSNNDTMFSLGLNIVALKQLKDSKRCCSHIRWQVFGHPAHIHGMEAIHIFFRFDLISYFLNRNMGWKWQLNNKTIDIPIIVDLLHDLQKCFFRYICIKSFKGRSKSTLFASLYLTAHIGLTCSIISYQNGCQMGYLT